VIRELIPYELGGAVDYVLAAGGARCELQIPAKWLRRKDGLHAASDRAGEQLHRRGHSWRLAADR
jgi:hypothetical protein